MPISEPELPGEVSSLLDRMQPADRERAMTILVEKRRAEAKRRAGAARPKRRRRAAAPFALTVRSELEDATPPVVRRLVLPSTLHLDELHGLLQVAHGWEDCHLHRFALGSGPFDADALHFLCPFDVDEGEDDGIPAHRVRLDEVFAAVGDELWYAYDYGDGREILLTVEAVDPGERRPQVLGAEGAAPPEDSGHASGWDSSVHPVDGAALDDAVQLWDRERLAARAYPPLVARLRQRALDHPVEEDFRAVLEAAAEPLPVVPLPGVERYAWLVWRVGSGLPLTQAGNLPRVVVNAAIQDLHLDTDSPGGVTREELSPPVATLRETAQRLGLVRKHRGRLLPTKQGSALADDPAALTTYVAARLVGLDRQPYEREAGCLVLLDLAAGRDPEAPEAKEQRRAVLGAAGWRSDAWYFGAVPYELAAVLRTLGVLEWWRRGDPAAPSDAARSFAQQALRAGR